MSADSLAMSTAVSTDMPTSAAFSAGLSLMPSPKKSDDMALGVKRADDAGLLRRRDLGEDRHRFGELGQSVVAHLFDFGAKHDAVRL